MINKTELYLSIIKCCITLGQRHKKLVNFRHYISRTILASIISVNSVQLIPLNNGENRTLMMGRIVIIVNNFLMMMVASD